MNNYICIENAQRLINHIRETQKAQQKEFFEDTRNLLNRMLNATTFNSMTYANGRFNQLIDDALHYDIISINTWTILYRMGAKIDNYCINRGFEK